MTTEDVVVKLIPVTGANAQNNLKKKKPPQKCFNVKSKNYVMTD